MTLCIHHKRKDRHMRHHLKTWEQLSLWSRSFSWEIRTLQFWSAMAWCLLTKALTSTRPIKSSANCTKPTTHTFQCFLLSRYVSFSRNPPPTLETSSKSSNQGLTSLSTGMSMKKPGFCLLISSLQTTNTIWQKSCSRSVWSTTNPWSKLKSSWGSSRKKNRCTLMLPITMRKHGEWVIRRMRV